MKTQLLLHKVFPHIPFPLCFFLFQETFQENKKSSISDPFTGTFPTET